MKSGYHQVEVDEVDKALTAFTVGPLGLFEYNRLPFGLRNAPATYQRLTEDILDDLVDEDDNKVCLVYLDDVFVVGR